MSGMSGISGTVLEVLADASLRAALVAALVAATLAVLRVRSGATQHAAWTIVLVAMLLMPVLSRLVPAVGVPVPTAARDIVAAAVATTPAPPAGRNPVPPAPAPLMPPRRALGASRDSAPAGRPPGGWPSEASQASRGPSQAGRGPSEASGWSWTTTVLAVYAAGMASMLLRLVLGLWGSRRLARGARPIEGSAEPAAGAMNMTARRRLAGFPVRIRESGRVAVPVTVGLFRPTVVLPLGWERWPGTTLRAVLAHERAHVARRDPLLAALASLNRCLFWFHPLAWWLRRTLALTAEQACDEAAVRTVRAPQAYVEVLRSMAAAVRARGGRFSWEGVGMHGSPSLTRRIAHIRRPPPGRAA